MREEYLKEALLVCATLVLGRISLASSPCERGLTWWNAKNSICLNCTICDAAHHLTVIRPCELHRNTLCGSLSQLNIQWPESHTNRRKQNEQNRAFTPPTTERNIVWRFPESREEILEPWHPITVEDNEKHSVHKNLAYDYDEHEDKKVKDEVIDQKTASIIKWDIQTTALTMAACGCIMFFVVVIFLSLYHSRHWKRLKQTLETDVQHISTKLRLMECGSVQQQHPAPPPPPPTDHFYSNIHHAGKDPLIDGASRKGLNNVYTQEKHSTY